MGVKTFGVAFRPLVVKEPKEWRDCGIALGPNSAWRAGILDLGKIIAELSLDPMANSPADLLGQRGYGWSSPSSRCLFLASPAATMR